MQRHGSSRQRRGRGAVQVGPGGAGAEPLLGTPMRRSAHRFRSGARADPEGRVRSQEGAAETARGGIGCQPVSRASGAEGEVGGQGETCQAAKARLASANVPGPRGADFHDTNITRHNDSGAWQD